MQLALLSFLVVLLFGGCASLAFFLIREKNQKSNIMHEAESARRVAKQREHRLNESLQQAAARNAKLEKWSVVLDAEAKAQELVAEARSTKAQAEADARVLTVNAEGHYNSRVQTAKDEVADIKKTARDKAKQLTEDANAAVRSATARAQQIINTAEERAEEIAGNAYKAVKDAELFEQTAKAMKNIIKGYGDEYLLPTASLLDDLAEEFSHKDAGRELKLARTQTQLLIKSDEAADCDYVEVSRKKGAQDFVLDAFNGKVDSILSKVKHDNAGTLGQQISDAFTVVNYSGKPFRNARIRNQYLEARLVELKWAAAAHELKVLEREEQRLIREQIREEQKARREYERAIKEADKEERMLKKAMEKAQAQIVSATQEQRAEYEAQLEELQSKLEESEQRNQRAISMAQQTRRGHVYIISNIGSFGESVYKIGLTRRLEPLDRVKELGDSSVPFEFDVHAMIMSDDAPALENQLHKHFVLNQLNKVNHRKEFFRATLAEIREELERLGIETRWTMTAEAREYRESLAIEKAIEDNPGARDAWLNKQLTLDPVDHAELELTHASEA